MKLLLTLVLIVAFSLPSSAQFGKLLKEKAKNLASKESLNKLKGLAGDKLDDARAGLDSTAFNFAISVNDNSDLVNTDTNKDKMLKLITNYKGDEEATQQEKARSLKDAGELAYAKGYYKQAEALLIDAKLLFETSDSSDVNYYTTIADLGLLYSTMGRYGKANDFTEQALELRLENLGEDNPGYGASLNNLSVLQKETGDYNEAEINIKKAIKVLETAETQTSMPVAIALNNQAMLYQAMGRYDQAAELMTKVIDISSDLQGEKSANHQKFLSNQAMLYREMGKLDESLALFKQLIKIKERRFGTKHPDYAHMLNNLASLYLQLDQPEEVEPLLKQSLKIYEDKFDKEHKLYASALKDLGNFYRYTENFDEAEKSLKESLEISRTVLGENHPEYVDNQEDIGILYWKMGNTVEAQDWFSESLKATMNFINDYFPPMSEAEKTKYWDKLRPRFETYFSFAFDGDKSDPIIKEAFNYHIATKGLLLNTSNKIKRQILDSGNEELKEQYLVWVDQKETLARFYGYSKEELEEQKVNLDSLENAANTTERWLSQKSEVFSDGFQLKQKTFNDVAGKLKTNEVAVEIIRYRTFTNKLSDDVKYAIVAVQPDQSFKHNVALNGSQLESRYFKYYNNAIKQKITDEYSFDQYWSPLVQVLSAGKKVYVSADGIYNQVNLNGLQKDGKYVLDSYDIHLVGNTKNLGASANSSSSKSAFLLGNPLFGSSDIDKLPGTAVELSAISRKLGAYGYKVKKYTQANAKEANIKQVESPRIVHIATHGYFLKDNELKGGQVFGVNSESAANNPLLRSGLLLANAGSTDQSSASLSSSNNGVLTAYEAINLRLDKTDLVVLSACETAVGDIKAGEGVYGLQRAFIGAGAKSLLMSLWKVDDQATQELMIIFYSNFLKSGNKRSAFRLAQKQLKTKYKHPYYWSSFVLVDN